MLLCYKSRVLGWVIVSSTTLLIGDSRRARPRFTNRLLLQPLRYVWRNDGSALAGLVFTGSVFLWGIPHQALPPTSLRPRGAPRFFIICSSSHPVATPHRSITATPFPVVALPFLLSSLYPLASQLTFLWGWLVSLTSCLKIIGGFTEIFTEADLHTMPYLSFAKNVLLPHLPVDSSGPYSSSLTCFSLEKLTVLSPSSFLRRVFLPNVKWKCLSISITVLLSCVPVRLGPEDATDFVLTILRSADLVSTSQVKVTTCQASGSAVNLAPTHSSFAPNSLSLYLRGISISSLYVVVSFVGRVCLNSSLDCSSNV